MYSDLAVNAGKLRITILCGANFRGPTEKVALGFGLELSRRGHRVLIAIRGNPESIRAEVSGDLPDGLEILSYRYLGPWVDRKAVTRARAFEPDVVHVFSPRSPVVRTHRRMYGDQVASVVAFEDDEWGLASFAGRPIREVVKRVVGRCLALAYPPAWPFVNRRSLRWVTVHGNVLHAITPALAREVEGRLGRSCEVLGPVHPSAITEEKVDSPTPSFGFDKDRHLLVFTGAVFSAHIEDFRLMLASLALLNQRGLDPLLVHAGLAAERFDLDSWARQAGIREGGFRSLGYLSSAEIHALLARADVLIQPGIPNEFNRLRLPSKLQTYLASGTPTVTYAHGAGELLEDRKEVLKTYGPGPEELADRIEELLGNSRLRQTLTLNAPDAAKRLFGVEENTNALERLYREALSRADS